MHCCSLKIYISFHMEPVFSSFVFFRCDITVDVSLHQIFKPGAIAAPITAKDFILLYLISIFDYLDTSRRAVICLW